MTYEPLTPEEQTQLAALFEKATGLKLQLPSRETIASQTNMGWITEFWWATKHHIQPMQTLTNQYRAAEAQKDTVYKGRAFLPLHYDPVDNGQFKHSKFIR